jgi:hypothetical protein
VVEVELAARSSLAEHQFATGREQIAGIHENCASVQSAEHYAPETEHKWRLASLTRGKKGKSLAE